MNSSLYRFSFLVLFQVLLLPVMAEDPPKVLGDYLKVGVPTRGEVVAVIPPPEIDKYMDRLKEAARSKPEWFAEYNKEVKPGFPMPYHENLGVTKEEHAEYLVLWGKREFKAIADGKVSLRLESPKAGEWVIRANGLGTPISLLRYDVKKDVMKSPNGSLLRLGDVDAKKESVLGEWTGHEWKFIDEGLLGKTKENFAIGKTASGEFGLLVYRLQEVSTEGATTYDRRMLIRFPLAKK